MRSDIQYFQRCVTSDEQATRGRHITHVWTFLHLFDPSFTSIILVKVMSMERLKLIMQPFSSLTLSKKRSHGLMSFVFCISFVVNIPPFRLVTVNGTTHIVKALKYEENKSFRVIVILSHCMFGLALPWLIMLVWNVVLVIKSYTRIRLALPRTTLTDIPYIS